MLRSEAGCEHPDSVRHQYFRIPPLRRIVSDMSEDNGGREALRDYLR